MSVRTTFTSESVTEGHPDKMADQISDSVLDAVLEQDPASRVACETLLTTGMVLVAGEISTEAVVDVPALVRATVNEIGYDDDAKGFNGSTCAVMVTLDRQSPDIAAGVDRALELRSGTGGEDILNGQGAGDQGMMFGFACDETPDLMPLPIWLSHRLAQRLAQVRRSGQLGYLRPDGKTQVSVVYEDGVPVGVDTVLISTQHAPGVDLEGTLTPDLTEHVITPLLPSNLDTSSLRILVNPTGIFELGGPHADTGLTGRKIIVDTYGGMARHGGGAFSGKDPSKVDRSAAYAARWVAKHVVASGAATRCEVQVAYAIGVARPVSLLVDTFGTERVDRAKIETAITELFDLRPAAIAAQLDLYRPIYKKTAAYGHFGRNEREFTWEQTPGLTTYAAPSVSDLDVSGERLLPTVEVLTEVTALERSFDYQVPEGFTGPLEIGSRVRVPLHGRSVRGWISGNPEDDRDPSTLKELRGSLGVGPPSGVLDLARWAAWRWNGTWAHFAKTASSDRIVRSLPSRPELGAIGIPGSWLGALGAERAGDLEAEVLELGPCTDPLDLVVGFLAGLGEAGRLTDKSALILVPGVGYAGRLVRRLARRKIAAVEAVNGWEASRAGWPVVVGSRAAAFAPLPSLGGVLVLDADDERFRSEAAPTWHAADVVLERARREHAPALFVTSCASSLEARLGRKRNVSASQEREGWPTVAVADRREDDPRHGLLSAHLVELARQALERQPEGVAVACLVNRTGRARLLACGRCETLLRCEQCDAAMGLEEELHCSRCGATRPAICQACGATKLKLLRLGTAQLAPELGALLGVEVAELTAKSTPESWQGARAVVGTEALLHRVRRCALVAFLDLDHHLLAPRVGSELRTLGLIGKAGRLVGARTQEGAGLVLLQTRLAEHDVVHAAQRGDPSAVIEADAELRRTLELPPFRALAKVKGPGAPELIAQLSPELLEIAELGDDSYAVLASSSHVLADALANVERPKARVVVSVDPESI